MIKRNTLIIIGLTALISISYKTIVKADTINVSNIINDDEYSNTIDIPKTMFYKKGTYEGVLTLQGTNVVSGEASRLLQYDSGDSEFTAEDYCIWHSDSYIMEFDHHTPFPPDSEQVTVDDYTFTAYLSEYEKGTYYTEYATPDVSRDIDEYPDDPWIGADNVSDGQEYNTAIHYWNERYIGSYNTPDTRKYVGIYAGTLINTLPQITSLPVVIEGNEYNSNDGTYWVKQNDDFTIKISGYTEFESNKYKINSLHALMENNKDEQKYFNGYIDNVENSSQNGNDGDEGELPISLMSTDVKRKEGNLTEAYFTSEITEDNQKIQIYPLIRIYEDSDYYDDSKIMRETAWWDKEKEVIVQSDGKAPGFLDTDAENVDSRVETTINMDSEFNISAIVSGLYDNGSGVNSVYAKIYPTNEDGTESNDSISKTIQLSQENGNWVLATQGAYDLFPYDTYKTEYLNIDVYTKDNVGNIGKIKSKTVDLFTVYAYVVPSQEPTVKGVPSLESGQYAILKILTGGYPDKLEITYPDELSQLDPSLNKIGDKSEIISPSKNLETDIPFQIPEYTPINNGYIVDVKAYRSKTESKPESYREDDENAKFNVVDNIYNGIRTRVR